MLGGHFSCICDEETSSKRTTAAKYREVTQDKLLQNEAIPWTL